MSAQDCTDSSGDPRPCTASEELDACLEAAVDAADQRAEAGDGNKITRFLEFAGDVADCATDYVGELLL